MSNNRLESLLPLRRFLWTKAQTTEPALPGVSLCDGRVTPIVLAAWRGCHGTGADSWRGCYRTGWRAGCAGTSRRSDARCIDRACRATAGGGNGATSRGCYRVHRWGSLRCSARHAATRRVDRRREARREARDGAHGGVNCRRGARRRTRCGCHRRINGRSGACCGTGHGCCRRTRRGGRTRTTTGRKNRQQTKKHQATESSNRPSSTRHLILLHVCAA